MSNFDKIKLAENFTKYPDTHPAVTDQQLSSVPRMLNILAHFLSIHFSHVKATLDCRSLSLISPKPA